MQLAEPLSSVLKKPAPELNIIRFTQTSIEVAFVVWVKRTDMTSIKKSLNEGVKQKIDSKQIILPPPYFSTTER